MGGGCRGGEGGRRRGELTREGREREKGGGSERVKNK